MSKNRTKDIMKDPEYQLARESEKTLSKLGHYRKYHEDFALQLVEWMAEGRTFTTFGTQAKVCPMTLVKWSKEHPEFEKAREIGKMYQLAKWEELALLSASGESPKSNPASLIFMLKNLFPMNYQDRRDTGQNNVGPATIIIDTGVDRGKLPDKAEVVEVIKKEQEKPAPVLIDNNGSSGLDGL